MKFEIGDRVRIKKFSIRPYHWSRDGGMDKYMETEAVIYKIGKYIKLCNGIDYKLTQWSWNEDDLEHLDMFYDNDFLI